MLNLIKNFFKEEDGLGTVEVVILIAVLVAVALIFGGTIKGIVQDMLNKVSGNATGAIDEIGGTGGDAFGGEDSAW